MLTFSGTHLVVID